jgi:Domain of unknown function (DUF4416)
MARERIHSPVLRFAAVFSHSIAAIDWACQRASADWGRIVLQTGNIPFNLTAYYQESMGDGLQKRLVAFHSLIDPSELVASKVSSNSWEAEYQATAGKTVSRSLNFDPGYVTEAKVVLATMKDRDHRLYLGSGVFGEVTLYYQLPGKWVGSRWTYPDYMLDEYHQFFRACRDYLRQSLQERSASG